MCVYTYEETHTPTPHPPINQPQHYHTCPGGDWWFNALAVEQDVGKFWRAHLKYAPHFPPGAQVHKAFL